MKRSKNGMKNREKRNKSRLYWFLSLALSVVLVMPVQAAGLINAPGADTPPAMDDPAVEELVQMAEEQTA